MSPDEVAKDIVIAMIEHSRLSSVDSVCNAYKQIIDTVNNPISKTPTK